MLLQSVAASYVTLTPGIPSNVNFTLVVASYVTLISLVVPYETVTSVVPPYVILILKVASFVGRTSVVNFYVSLLQLVGANVSYFSRRLICQSYHSCDFLWDTCLSSSSICQPYLSRRCHYLSYLSSILQCCYYLNTIFLANPRKCSVNMFMRYNITLTLVSSFLCFYFTYQNIVPFRYGQFLLNDFCSVQGQYNIDKL